MSTVQEIEKAICQLSEADRATFRDWFAEYDAVEWDQKFETDVKSGRLDWLVNETRQDLREGRCTDR